MDAEEADMVEARAQFPNALNFLRVGGAVTWSEWEGMDSIERQVLIAAALALEAERG